MQNKEDVTMKTLIFLRLLRRAAAKHGFILNLISNAKSYIQQLKK